MLAGQYDTVLVFGIEQLTALGGGTIPLQRNDHKTELYAKAGMVLPAVYAMRGTRFLHERGATPADLAAVAVKNRHHGSLNEYAQQRTEDDGRGGAGLAHDRRPADAAAVLPVAGRRRRGGRAEHAAAGAGHGR